MHLCVCLCGQHQLIASLLQNSVSWIEALYLSFLKVARGQNSIITYARAHRHMHRIVRTIILRLIMLVVE